VALNWQLIGPQGSLSLVNPPEVGH
jgi:hypothetical protein